jgi:hypothetical protein
MTMPVKRRRKRSVKTVGKEGPLLGRNREYNPRPVSRHRRARAERDCGTVNGA